MALALLGEMSRGRTMDRADEKKDRDDPYRQSSRATGIDALDLDLVARVNMP